jgi:hypothetical protein
VHGSQEAARRAEGS